MDGGKHWFAATVPGAGSLDFRDVKAFDERTAYLVSSGPGDQSRIYKTTDGGARWTLLFQNPDAKGFFDAIGFWDRTHGILLGDPVNSQFAIFTTGGGGQTWVRRGTPPALPGEGAFAASGTSIVAVGRSRAWFGTGGPAAGRIFHTADGGRSWTVASTPLTGVSPSAGIYSLAFRDELHGIAVGGDYQKPLASGNTIALTDDGGRTWRTPKQELAGYRSGVVFLDDKRVIAVGPSGSEFSSDGGETWKAFPAESLNAVAASGRI